jgi:hypothetical protein
MVKRRGELVGRRWDEEEDERAALLVGERVRESRWRREWWAVG